MEFAQAAERLVSIAQKNALAEVQSAEDMMTETKATQQYTDNAALQLRNADAAENSAQVYSTSVRKELEYRVQQLVELNRPTLFDPGGWTSRSSASFQGSNASASGYGYAKTQGNTTESASPIESLPFQEISLTDIEDVPIADLSQSRLDRLEHGHDPFEQVLYNRLEPITLDKGSGKPYKILGGRHRIYLARQKGWSSVPAKLD
jgi:putative ubiquitin-RnfH superfamily antitoxin RatB of RatAB toxin-antitoxin module